MSRWIIPASLVAILISLTALGILLATSSTSPPEDVAAPEQVEEPDTSSQPTPEQEAEPEPGSEVDPGDTGDAPQQEEESADRGEQTTQQAPTQPGPRTAVVRITGDASYYCSLGVIGESETLQGRQPASYEVEVSTGGTSLETVMATCQKISPGALGVQIRYDDEVVDRDETETRLGTVSVSWNPLEQ